MSDPGTNPNPEGGAEAARPEYLPETYWDAEARAPKADALKADLAELPTLRELKTQQETRAASLPKEAKDYKVELPSDFQIPEGKKFQPDENDPMVAIARDIAKEYGLDQSQFTGMVGRYAKMVLEGEAKAIEADKVFLAEQDKLLGEKAAERRNVAKTWMGANLTEEQANALEGVLDTKAGVEAIESIISNINGTTTRGNPTGGQQPNPNAELAEKVGKVPAMQLFQS